MEAIEFPITVAYNMLDKKIACVLIQAAMGATISRSWITFTFGTKYWELSPDKCKLYIIKSQKELELMVRLTQGYYDE